MRYLILYEWIEKIGVSIRTPSARDTKDTYQAC